MDNYQGYQPFEPPDRVGIISIIVPCKECYTEVLPPGEYTESHFIFDVLESYEWILRQHTSYRFEIVAVNNLRGRRWTLYESLRTRLPSLSPLKIHPPRTWEQKTGVLVDDFDVYDHGWGAGCMEGARYCQGQTLCFVDMFSVTADNLLDIVGRYSALNNPFGVLKAHKRGGFFDKEKWRGRWTRLRDRLPHRDAYATPLICSRDTYYQVLTHHLSSNGHEPRLPDERLPFMRSFCRSLKQLSVPVTEVTQWQYPDRSHLKAPPPSTPHAQAHQAVRYPAPAAPPGV